MFCSENLSVVCLDPSLSPQCTSLSPDCDHWPTHFFKRHKITLWCQVIVDCKTGDFNFLILFSFVCLCFRPARLCSSGVDTGFEALTSRSKGVVVVLLFLQVLYILHFNISSDFIFTHFEIEWINSSHVHVFWLHNVQSYPFFYSCSSLLEQQ